MCAQVTESSSTRVTRLGSTKELGTILGALAALTLGLRRRRRGRSFANVSIG